ncbi:Gfo/Idh/MocA family oxidoreductase [soil metagenome]
MDPLRIGIVGCGAISGIYLQNLAKFRSTQVVAVADLDLDRARQVAANNGVSHALEVDALLSHADIELVLNLTVPKAHASVATKALLAGKHVYNEKPLTISNEEARALVELAASKGLLVGCAPDTFLGAGQQTCRSIVDSGAIGEVVAASAAMLCRGHETWHPSPEFYYENGGGPMLDMGPYYVNALINLLGGAKRVCGMVRASFPTRTITSQPKHGKVITVETATHLTGEIEFANGAIAHLTTSFDVYANHVQPIVIYGSEGTMLVPDPNGFDGGIQVKKAGGEFESVHLKYGFADNSRGLGVLDMAHQIRSGTKNHRASGELAAHSLEVMNAFTTSSEEERFVHISPLAARPLAMDPLEFAGEVSI